MTYVLQLVRRHEQESTEDVVERIRAGEEEAPDPAEIRRIGSLLTAALPSLTRADVPKGWRLTHAGSGAQISMQGDEFRIAVPRTHATSTARSVWNDLAVLLTTLQAEGYAAWDPQLGRLLDIGSDLDLVIAEYAGRPQQEPAQTMAAAAPKPWWKFW